MPTISLSGLETSRLDELDLLRRAAGGDAEAFDQLVGLHEPRIRRLAFRLLGWRDGEVEDVVQDVFVAMFKRLGSFRRDSRLSTWLTSVTLNRCRSIRRRRVLRLRWFRAQHVSPGGASSESEARRDETSAQVRRAIAELSAADREVIVLFYLEQLSIADIATLLNVRANTVEVRLHRARQRLKLNLKDFMAE